VCLAQRECQVSESVLRFPHRNALPASTFGDLVFPLLQVAAVVPVRGPVAAESVLAVVAGSLARVGS